jgi:predicted metal-dependent hydrolase
MSSIQTPPGHQVIPRANLDFGFDGDIPRHWFEGDAFKTRFFDSMSTLFPEGERFFIECVRDYRDQVTDPELKQQVRDFMFQEGQHGQQHDRFNDRLGAQGVRIDIIAERNRQTIAWWRTWMPKSLTLSMTAAAEHLTAIMAHAFMNDRDMFAKADPRLRALYFWHAIEEIEHKAVAFDVMQKAAKVGYFTRVFGLMLESVMFPLFTFIVMSHMFQVDGVKQKWKVWAKGLWWLYGPRGIMTRLIPAYLKYYLPGFHPWSAGRMTAYDQWLEAFKRNGGDPVAATDEVMGTRTALPAAA